jgi:endo-1,4-beta-xylanase
MVTFRAINEYLVRSFLLASLALTPVMGGMAKAQTLKEAYRGLFHVGVALNTAQIDGSDRRGDAIIEAQFNTISPENALKWQWIQPDPGKYNFELADRYVAFGQRNGMFVVGHCLVWHSQVPRWVFQDAAGNPLTREALLARMREPIFTVVGRYKGRIGGWDVVNEALKDDGTLRDSPWLKIIGDDYIAKAFQFAHEADPQAELYYNDYSLENDAKRQGALRLIRNLQAAGVSITGVGLQGHVRIDGPTPQKEAQTIEDFAGLGLKVNISELDVDVLPRTTKSDSADVSQVAVATANSDPYTGGLPDVMQRALADRYAELFSVFVAHHQSMGRVTLWGLSDGGSWLNNFPARGRTNYPLLFDREDKPKPAFKSVLEVGETNQNKQRSEAGGPVGAEEGASHPMKENHR